MLKVAFVGALASSFAARVGAHLDRPCDIALTDGPSNAGSALCGISEPGGEHSQSLDGGGSSRQLG